MFFGTDCLFSTFQAASTDLNPMPMGSWVIAPASSPLRIASICCWPESYPMTTTLPVLPDSLTPFSTPMAEPSFAPKTPLRFGLACRIVFVISVDLSWSPPPYCVATILMFGYLLLIWSVKPLTRSMPVRLVWSCATIATSPLMPMSVAILSAAAAAAAMLSVAAVATGMSLSTPESKPMTGMFWSFSFWSSGIAALLSSAAKQSAFGFLLIAACSISICLSTCDSFSGPSNVMVTLYCAAAFSAPCRTACQNWCWKPFEIIGMKSLAAALGLLLGLALGLLLAVLAGVPPQAAANRTTPARPPNPRIGLPLMLTLHCCSSPKRAHDQRLVHLPRGDLGDALPMTGFRQVRRISVVMPCYRLAPWGRLVRSLGPREGLLTC